MLADMREHIVWFEVVQAWAACPSGKGSIKTEMSAVNWWNGTGETPSTRRKTFPNATLSTTDLTWTALGSSLGLHCEASATNRLSQWAALFVSILRHKEQSLLPLYKPVSYAV
jgi:hypothetical protein